MSDESSFDFSVEEIEDVVVINSVFRQPAVFDSPPAIILQIQADEVDDMDFDSSSSEEQADEDDEETEIETPAKGLKVESKKGISPFSRRLRLPILNKDTVLSYTYDIEYTLSKRVQKAATAQHRIHNSHYSTTLIDHFNICKRAKVEAA